MYSCLAHLRQCLNIVQCSPTALESTPHPQHFSPYTISQAQRQAFNTALPMCLPTHTHIHTYLSVSRTKRVPSPTFPTAPKESRARSSYPHTGIFG